MKTIVHAIALLLFGVALAFSKEEPLKLADQLAIGEFAREAALDWQEGFRNIEKKLIGTPEKEYLRDRKFEVLIDLIWKIDKKIDSPRTLTLLEKVRNKELRQKIYRDYKRLENATKLPETV